MSAFITLNSVSLTTPDARPLFDGLTLSVGQERTGLVGRNGCGKSTLLSLLAGDVSPASGTVQRAGRVGRLEQVPDETLSVAEALGVAVGLECLKRLAAGEGSVADAAEADWTLEARLAEALSQTGLPEMDMDRAMRTLSGGERTRVMLARLLLAAPDVLLLDEPTNNLDTDGRTAIGDLMARWKGGVVVASHDRALLEHVDRIVELTPVSVTVFGGGWSAFKAARDAARARAEAELDRAGSELKRTERDAQAAREKQDRRDKTGRAARARGDAPKMLLDARAQRAEATRARGNDVAERLGEAGREAFDAARARGRADRKGGPRGTGAILRLWHGHVARLCLYPGHGGLHARPGAGGRAGGERVWQDDAAAHDRGRAGADRRGGAPADRARGDAGPACQPAGT